MQNQTRNLVIVALVAVLVVVTCWKQAPGQGEAAKSVLPCWEYKQISASESALNELGAEGWEVCAAFAKVGGGGGSISTTGYAILRRPKAGK